MADRIKPSASDTIGLTQTYSQIGVSVVNANVLVTNFSYYYTQDMITFEAISFWNKAAADQYLIDKSILPFRPIDFYTIYGIDPNKSLVNQCCDYLLALPQYNGSQGGGALLWIKT